MNVHKNARMTVHGRLLLVMRVREQGWRVEDAVLFMLTRPRTVRVPDLVILPQSVDP